jgi:hypothetical protein
MTTATNPIEFREMTWTLYSALSSPAGLRNWDAVRQYYHPEARLVRTGVNPDGTRFARVMTLEIYIENVEELLKDVNFTEVELSHEAVIFGNVARLTSVYEFSWKSATECRQGRGVNFFTVIRDADLWRIMSIVWDSERAGLALPKSLTQELNSRTI